MRKTESKTDQETKRKWLSKWWPCLLLIAITVWGIIDYFFILKSDQTDFIKFLLNVFGVFAVVVYVIYTKELSESSQQIARANIRLVESMQSRILEQWFVERCKTVNLIDGGKELSKVIHVTDKQNTNRQYEEYISNGHSRILVFRPMNVGVRPIVLKSIKFKISDSRSGLERDISYNPDPPVIIPKDSTMDIQVCYDMEGEINARVAEIDYQDGPTRQTSWIANPFAERRFHEEEEPEEEESEDEIPF